MIQVANLTKQYAGQSALRGLSFQIAPGEIVGLLGPNGAGKTTAMRILAGYIPATSGTARVAGYDVFSESDAVRKRIGYLPENNPLYPEMRVKEYLKFRARLKGLRRGAVRESVEAVIEQCGLTDVRRKIIGQLSMGYRQRVGLADALVHRPELLILDEPTLGLDPNQIRSVRALIQGLAGRHTVLLSTHILPEVEMTCSRVLILHQGEIRADDATDHLQQWASQGGEVVAEIAASPEDLRTCWEETPEIERYQITPAEGGYHRCALVPRSGVDLRPQIYEQARSRGWGLRELTRHRFSLEDVFIQLTREEETEE